jgi:hypothetical protein
MLYLLLIEKEKKKGETARGLFPGPTHHIGCAMPGFSWLLDAIQICFKGSP